MKLHELSGAVASQLTNAFRLFKVACWKSAKRIQTQYSQIAWLGNCRCFSTFEQVSTSNAKKNNSKTYALHATTINNLQIPSTLPRETPLLPSCPTVCDANAGIIRESKSHSNLLEAGVDTIPFVPS